MTTVRVLIAEDNEDHLFLATYALRGVPDITVEVTTAKDGQEALDMLLGDETTTARVLPNLVLLDLSMPRKSGLEVLQAVKADATVSHIPVVVLTSSDRPEDIDAAYGLGASSYVQKSKGLKGLTDFWISTATLPRS